MACGPGCCPCGPGSCPCGPGDWPDGPACRPCGPGGWLVTAAACCGALRPCLAAGLLLLVTAIARACWLGVAVATANGTSWIAWQLVKATALGCC